MAHLLDNEVDTPLGVRRLHLGKLVAIAHHLGHAFRDICVLVNGDLRAPLALGEDIVVGGVARVGRGVVAALLRSREPVPKAVTTGGRTT